MRNTLLTLLLMLPLALPAAEVFRWVDEDGVIHYSDRPRDGAERIELRDAQTFAAPPMRTRTPTPTGGDAATASVYETLEIVRPAQEEVLWNIEGQLEVSMRLQPGLEQGHSIELYLDDRRIEELAPRSLQARLSEVFRGAHTLRAQIRDSSGTVLIQSEPRTFVVQQTSVQNPSNPNVPRPTPR
jgi:hypothetical protein